MLPCVIGWTLAALLVCGAAPQNDPLELVRQGNQAFTQEEYEAALELYRQAETRSTDPGLVAYNEATALYRLGRYREAEWHYRRALEGAVGARRRHGLYGLGNALLQRSGGTERQSLWLAVQCYQLCLQEPGLSRDLQERVCYNLELARLLLLKAEAQKPKSDQPGDQETPGQEKNFSRQPEMNAAGEPPDADDGQRSQDKTAEGPQAKESRKPVPGKGNLETLPDESELVPLAPEDTLAHLEQIRQRILRQRQQDWQAPPQTNPRIKDW